MNHIKKILSILTKQYVSSSPAAAAVPYALGAFMTAFYFIGEPEPDRLFLLIGLLMIFTAAAVQSGNIIFKSTHGILYGFLTDYDKKIIGKAFSRGNKKFLFYEALELLISDNEFSSALDILTDLKDRKLTDSEQGVLGFYTSICYSRMGYTTNAAQCAAIAAEKEVQLPESLLMAARNYSLSANYSLAGEYYERLVPIAENNRIFPFIFNEVGKMYISANKPEKSRKYFEKSIEYGLDPIISQGGLAIASMLEGKEDEACERYRLALIANISDSEEFKIYCAQICTANGYPENYFEEHLKERFNRSTVNN